MQPVLQAGNEVEAVWRARLEEHLGLYAVEAAVLRTDAADFQRRRRCMASICSARCCAFCPNAIRIRPCSTGRRFCSPISPAAGAGAFRAFRTGAAGRTRLRPRSRPMRRDGFARRPDLCFAEMRPRRQPRRRRALGDKTAAAAGFFPRGAGNACVTRRYLRWFSADRVFSASAMFLRRVASSRPIRAAPSSLSFSTA